MKKTLVGLLIFLFGFVLSTALFYEGYQRSPVLEWRWSLKNRQADCLIFWQEVERKEMGYITGIHTRGDEIFCIKNNAPEL